MIIKINTITWEIIIEKGEEIKTAPIVQHPIQYNEINIKRKYYKKGDPEYHRRQTRPLCKPSQVLKILKQNRTVKQEPLLALDF